MKTTVDVTVETLKNKLYLFQTYPKMIAELTYINGNGETHTVSTDNDGALALYEESGIVSDVRFKAQQENETLYFTTVYNSRLLSGEQDSTRLAQYPINHVRMREAAKTTLFLKKPDGTPYFGKIKVNGGVYKNGNYCEKSQIEPTGEYKEYPLGSDGKLVIDWDITEFWSEEAGEGVSENNVLEEHSTAILRRFGGFLLLRCSAQGEIAWYCIRRW